ncbi:hypothetical protein O3P69_017094 [Scylla paramamosain]|uniref:Uncharacterized protein n=1 Tax=Scylla paramamosain TaxID=85552 RepID=A0AAW0TU76_SCYPA
MKIYESTQKRHHSTANHRASVAAATAAVTNHTLGGAYARYHHPHLPHFTRIIVAVFVSPPILMALYDAEVAENINGAVSADRHGISTQKETQTPEDTTQPTHLREYRNSCYLHDELQPNDKTRPEVATSDIIGT